MKKSVSFILIILLLLSTLNFMSCSNRRNDSTIYDSYICDMANDGIITEMEKEWWNGILIKNSLAEKEKEITVQGVTYDFSYDFSEVCGFSSHYVDIYRSKDTTIQISVLPSSNEVVGFHRYDLFDDEYLLKQDLYETSESALPMAKEIASRYIGINDYRVESQTSDSYSKKIKEHIFDFVRYVDGYPTCEGVYIAITSKGDFRTLAIHDIGLFENKQISVDKDVLQKSIDKKLNKIYTEDLGYNYTYKIVKQTLAYSPENDLVVVSQIEVSVKDKYNTGVLLATVIE